MKKSYEYGPTDNSEVLQLSPMDKLEIAWNMVRIYLALKVTTVIH